MWTQLRRWLFWLPLSLAIVDWLALKTRVVSHPPWVLGVFVCVAFFPLFAHFAKAFRGLCLRRRERGVAFGQSLFFAGMLLALIGGLVNWAFSLQGFVILNEMEAIPLHTGSHLQGFVAGPLSNVAEMDLVMMLEELELVPAGGESFYPRSQLYLSRKDEEPTRVEVSSRESAHNGTLRFYQGAFGFAPRIVIIRSEETVFDGVVPFTTARRGSSGVSFEGHFELEKECLEIVGSLDLASLEDGMRGHASLVLSVSRHGRLLGRGSLLPGHFAELAERYRVGFVGLGKWSEIDIARRDYGEVVLLGAGLILAGGILWPVARRRGW